MAHASCAFLPFIVSPPSIWTTAEPRPIAAIVPLSRYLNGSGLLAGDEAGDRLADVLTRLQRDRAELRQHLLGLRVGDRRDVADGVDLGMVRDAELARPPNRLPRCELESEPVDERVALSPAPQTSVWALITVPDLRVTRRSPTDCTTSPVRISTWSSNT